MNTCSASGAGHSYKWEVIPSEYISGVEGGEPTKILQCEYCGEQSMPKPFVIESALTIMWLINHLYVDLLIDSEIKDMQRKLHTDKASAIRAIKLKAKASGIVEHDRILNGVSKWISGTQNYSGL